MVIVNEKNGSRNLIIDYFSLGDFQYYGVLMKELMQGEQHSL